MDSVEAGVYSGYNHGLDWILPTSMGSLRSDVQKRYLDFPWYLQSPRRLSVSAMLFWYLIDRNRRGRPIEGSAEGRHID